MAKHKVKFEDVLKRVEEIIQELEAGELSLDESLARYEEGAKALKQCYEILQEAERRIEILLKGENGELHAQPFEPQAGEEQESTPSSAPENKHRTEET